MFLREGGRARTGAPPCRGVRKVGAWMLILLRVCGCYFVCFNYACVFSLGDGGENELVHAPHWLEATTRALAMVCLSENLAFFGTGSVSTPRPRGTDSWKEISCVGGNLKSLTNIAVVVGMTYRSCCR